MRHAKYANFLIAQSRVLIVDDNPFMRRIVRSLLINIGIKRHFEARDGIEALDQIRNISPDIVILDWEMPLLNGPELVRIVRSPGVFPMPDIPIIMLSGHSEHRRIVEAMKIGVNEFLCKPVSAKALQERFISILMKPRPNVQLGDYYGPEPRVQLPEPGAQFALPVAINESVGFAPGGKPIGVNDANAVVLSGMPVGVNDPNGVEPVSAEPIPARPATHPPNGDCVDIDTLTTLGPTVAYAD